MRHVRSAFTLIELLVVIAIIAVLAGLLMPALSRVRASATALTFGSNMRQLSMAMMAYVSDSHGVFPMHSDGSPGDHWHDHLRPLLDDTNTLVPWNSNWLNPTQRRHSLFHDPAELQPVYDVAINNTGEGRSPAKSYGIAGRRVSSVRKTAELMMFGPGITDGTGGLPSDNIWVNGTTNYVPYSWFAFYYKSANFLRHGHAAPFAFADGHVETITAQRFDAEVAAWATDNSPFFGML